MSNVQQANLEQHYTNIIGRVLRRPEAYLGEFGTCVRTTLAVTDELGYVHERRACMLADEDGECESMIYRFLVDATTAYENSGSSRMLVSGLINHYDGENSNIAIINDAYLVPQASIQDAQETLRGIPIPAKLSAGPSHISIGLLEIPGFNRRGFVSLVLDDKSDADIRRTTDILATAFDNGKHIEALGSFRGVGNERFYVDSIRAIPPAVREIHSIVPSQD